MDPFEDLLSEPTAVNVRARAKFQPKGKIRNKKEAPILPPSSLHDTTKEKAVTTESKNDDTLKSAPPSVDPAEIGSTDHVPSLDESSEMQCSWGTVNDQSRNKLPISRPFTSEADCPTSCPEASSIQTSMDLEEGPSPPKLSSEPTGSNTDFLVSGDFLKNRGSADFANHGDLGMDDGMLGREKENFQGYPSNGIISGGTTTADPSEAEYYVEDTHPFPPDGYVDLSTMGVSDPVSGNEASEIHVTEELGNIDDIPSTEVVDSFEYVGSENVNLESPKENARPAATGNEGNGTRKSSRQLQKRLNAGADETAEVAQEKHVDETEKTVRKRRKTSDPSEASKEVAPKKKFSHSTRRNKRRRISKFLVVCLCNSFCNIIFSLFGFSFSFTFVVDKALLDTPEDEINPRKLPIKDLIMLAEARERRAMKDGNVSKNSLPNQRNSFAQDDPYGTQDQYQDPYGSMQDQYQDPYGSMQDQYNDPYGSMQDQDPFGTMQDHEMNDDDEAAPTIEHSSIKINYHSHMEKTPKNRWSKQDTELFYQGLHTFGPNFAMIQHLLLGRTRNQVKMKFKREERLNPQLVRDALENRSQNQTLIDLVIERIKKAAAEADPNSDREESIGPNDEEEVAPETNEGSGNVQEGAAEKVEEKGRKSEEGMVGEEGMEADEVVNEETEEDLYNRWSQYKCDYD